ncbi:MAG: DUF983 domain-containing protein [Pseudomonadota bacterium]
MTHVIDTQASRPDLADQRDLSRALRRGWRRTCPACGGGPLFDGYLKVRARCVSCGEPLEGHQADDLPAWATIMIVGHVMGFLLLHTWDFDLPIWVHWVLWPPLSLLMTLLLLPRIKGMVVGFQWAKRLAGFARSRAD